MIETKTLKRSSTNSDIKMEVNAISDYLKPNMPLPQYLPYARFLLDTDLSHTAKLLYTLLLDRATLSQKNNWMDAQGRIYVVYPLSKLSKDLRCTLLCGTMADHARREPWAAPLGRCGHRQEFPCRVHCKRSDGAGGACAYDKLRPNPERVEQQLFRAERCCGQALPLSPAHH